MVRNKRNNSTISNRVDDGEWAWPFQAASAVHFLVPPEMSAKGQQQQYGMLSFNASKDARALSLVSVQDPGRVFGVLNIDDVIGAGLEMKLNNGSEDGKGTAAQAATAAKRTSSNEPATEELRDKRAAVYLTIYNYPQKRNPPSVVGRWMEWCGWKSKAATESIATDRQAQHWCLQVAPQEDLTLLSQLTEAINRLARPFQSKPSKLKYLVIVNPVSGPKRNGARVAKEIVRPMLEQAGVECDLVVTQHAQHAAQLVSSKQEPESAGSSKDSCSISDLTAYNAIVLVGGDGIIHEVFNGIRSRARNDDDDDGGILARLPIGVVGCGTANGMAASVAYASGEKIHGAIQETFLICKGRTTPADLSLYQTTSNSATTTETPQDPHYTSFLTFSWGMIADVDIESECLRCLGEARFDLWAVWCILRLRTYRARFSYLPATTADNDKESKQEQEQTAKTSSIVPSCLPPLTEPVPSHWTTIEDDFVVFWASHVSHASMNVHQSPSSQLQDGVFQILVVRGPAGRSRWTLARILLGLDSGQHVHVPGVEVVTCRAYRLEPLVSSSKSSPSASFNDLDGEVIESGPIQALVRTAAWNVFCGESNQQQKSVPNNVDAATGNHPMYPTSTNASSSEPRSREKTD